MVQLEKVSASHPRHWLTHTRHSQCVCAHVWVCVKHIKPHTQKHTHTHTDHSLSLWISHKPLLQSCFHIRFLPHGADGKQTVCWYIYYFTLCVCVCVCVWYHRDRTFYLRLFQLLQKHKVIFNWWNQDEILLVIGWRGTKPRPYKDSLRLKNFESWGH